jgi:hypothetical protein
MAFSKEVLDEILKDYHGPDDFYGPEGIMKQLAKALVERTMEAEITGHPGYEKSDPGEKQNVNRRNGKSAKSQEPAAGRRTLKRPGTGRKASSRKLSPSIKGSSGGLMTKSFRCTRLG